MLGHAAARSLRLWVLACFALALLAATASPLVRAGTHATYEVVCSTGGHAKLVVIQPADGLAHATHDGTGAQCPMCLPLDAPPATAGTAPAFAAPAAAAPSPHAQPSWLRVAQRGPPARAPPFQPSAS